MNHFSFQIKNQTAIINYCGRQVAIAFWYMDDIYTEFTENQPMIPSQAWKYLTSILNTIKSRLNKTK